MSGDGTDVDVQYKHTKARLVTLSLLSYDAFEIYMQTFYVKMCCESQLQM